MKSSVYKIVGCSGSKRYQEVKSLLSARDARKEAVRQNREMAFRLGVGYRALLRDAGEWGRREGLHTSGRSGHNGQLTGF